MKSFSQFLGPKATKKQDAADVVRQKKNLSRLAGEYHKMSKDEGGGGMAKAHGDMFANTKKNIHSEGVIGRFLSKAINKAHELNKKTPLPKASDRREFQKPQFEETVQEDGGGAGGVGGGTALTAAPTNTVAGVAGTGDWRLPASQREPGVPKNKKKHSPLLPMGIGRRKLPR